MKITRPICNSVFAKLLQSGLLVSAFAISQAAHAVESAVDQHQLGTKFSPLQQINKDNVANLEKAWEYHTGDIPPKGIKNALIAAEDQPSMIEGNLVVCSTTRKVIALDPASGQERWKFDPKDPLESKKIGLRKCRGISHWIDNQAADGTACKSRIFLGTADYRLIAIDAKNGKPCDDFGDHGSVKMPGSKPELFPGELLATSNPAIVNDVVVVGSVVADGQRVDAPSGRVLAYDARSGKPVWQFDPVPRDPADPAMKSWGKGTASSGGGNVWSSMAVDQKLDLVYLPTTSASGDFYGGSRPGNNNYTTSVVALHGKTGAVAWHYQVVHHNVFDYDVPSQPMLIDYPNKDGKLVPALVQNTKMGLIFVFDRETGEPLVPIEERKVPQTGKAEGEVLSPTQPFPVGMPAVMPQSFSLDDTWGFTPVDKYLCRKQVEKLNYGSIYTPASEQGTVFVPSSGGGPNWGGGAYDPVSHIMVVPSNRVALVVKLERRENVKLDGAQAIESGGPMAFPNTGTPYVTKIQPLLSPLGAPCTAPPWAALTAVDLVNKKIVWEVPLGSIHKMSPIPMSKEILLGTPGAGGPLMTATGLVFIGYTLDDSIRAFDLKTGNVLWKAELPAAGMSVPVTYEAGGEQYIVIAAGGHTMYGSTMGDSVVAFKLKR